MNQFSPYQTRPVRFLELVDYRGWQIKVYGIRARDGSNKDRPDGDVIELAKAAMLAELPQTAVSADHHGVGFLIIHQGEARNWLLLDWWFDQSILKQKLFSAPLSEPAQITTAEPDLMACVWELAVHLFERQAWLETVLNNPAGADINAYLQRRFNGDV